MMQPCACYDFMDVIFLFLNKDGTILKANKKCHAFMGYPYPELHGKNWFDTCIPHDRRINVKQVFLQLMNGNIIGTEYYQNAVQIKNGDIRIVYWHNSLIRDDHTNEIIGTMSTGEDITEKLEIQEKYYDIVESANDAILLIDLDGTIRSVNQITFTLLGYDKTEIQFLNIFQCIAPEYHRQIRQMIDEKLSGKRMNALYEIEAMTKTGDRLWIEVNSSVLTRDSIPYAFHIIARDIRMRKRDEADRIRSVQLELTSLISSGIAHDFNNILMGMMGNITMLDQACGNDSQQYIESIRRAILHATDLTKKLMVFAKIERKFLSPISILDVLADADRFVIRGSRSKCVIQSIENLPMVNANHGDLVQVFSNLLINASQAMPNGGIINVDVSIDTSTTNSRVRVAVHDNGIGIPKDIQSKIFQPYFTTKASGNGLGLASSYYIIRQYGGIIQFESNPEHGTTFEVYIPASNELIG